MIDANGYRSNVGIILTNDHHQVFWAKRIGQDAWQFPQGGLNEGEDIEETLFRELHEEIGLVEQDVRVIGSTRHWLRYKIPKRLIRDTIPTCIGQKQKWFLLKLETDEDKINFAQSTKPEFDNWSWVSYWYPLRQVISFKRGVYRRALKELLPFAVESGPKNRVSHPLNHILEG